MNASTEPDGELVTSPDALAPDVEPHVRPRWAALTIVAFLGLVACTNVANVVWAEWVEEHPAGLLALSSRLRYLVFAAAGGIDGVPYAVIGALRIAAAFVVCHLAGRAHRDARPEEESPTRPRV